MSKYRFDESIESYNTPTATNLGFRPDYGIYRCMVIDRKFKDNTRNMTNKAINARVIYDVVVLGGFKEGEKISNCRFMTDLGGNINFSEIILKPTSKKLNTNLADQDGDIVYVAFIQGNIKAPVIIGCDNHLSNSNNANLEDGTRKVTEYNGVNIAINKNGEYVVNRTGGTYNSTKQEFEKTENGQEATIQLINDNIIIQDPANGIIINKSGKTITISTNSGATNILIDGTTDKINIIGENITLGDATLEFIVKDAMLTSWINDKINQVFNSHTHIGNMGVPTAGPSASFDTVTGTDIASLKHKVE